MTEPRYFPEIMVKKTGNAFEGIACLKLKSILMGELVRGGKNYSDENEQGDKNGKSSTIDPRRLQTAREALLQAVSSWPSSISLEMGLTSLPDLIYKAQGRILISLFIRVASSSKNRVREEIVRSYLGLMPLLIACLPEAEFEPIVDMKELEARFSPFKAAHAIALHRREMLFSLEAPLRSASIGFGPIEEKSDEENSVVHHIFPWMPSMDDWSRLMDALMWQLDPVQIIVRICPGAGTEQAVKRLEKMVCTCELFLSGTSPFQISSKRQTTFVSNVALKQLTGYRDTGFRLGVCILSPHPIDTSLINLLGSAITGPGHKTDGDELFQGGFAMTQVSPRDAVKSNFFVESEPFTIAEAACAFRIPSPPMGGHPALPVKRSRTCLALFPKVSLADNDINRIGLFVNEHNGSKQPVRIDADDRMRHVFVIGQTGTGKSTLLQAMALNDIRAGKGLAVIDPHGDMIDFILGRIPDKRADDVILFDFLDRERPLGFNLLQWTTHEERDLIVDELYQAIDQIYDMRETGGPIFEMNFRGMLKFLMGEKTRGDFVPTILEFPNCYLHSHFRNWLKNNTKDTTTLDFLKELERTGGDASLNNLSPYVTSKLARFIHDTVIRRIIGQEKSSLDFDAIMNEGKILLIKLGKGRFGQNLSALLTSQVVSRFKMAAMKRAEIPHKNRRDFFLYVDECHNLPRENFIELLSEARKYRMGLTLATQYASQLGNPNDRRNDLLSSILGNVGTMVLFRLGQEDAKFLAPAIYPTFSSVDITGLPNWHGYCRMQPAGEAMPAFSFKTVPDKTPFNEGIAQKIIGMSRIKYGTECTVIDAQIKRRREIWMNPKDLVMDIFDGHEVLDLRNKE